MGMAKKILYSAVGLVITVALIYAAVGLLDRSKRLADAISREQDRELKAFSEYSITKYDGYKISGSQVIGYVKSLVSTYGTTVEITTETATFSVSDSSLFGALRDIDSIYYVNPLKMYECSVVRDVNDAITEVQIVVVP